MNKFFTSLLFIGCTLTTTVTIAGSQHNQHHYNQQHHYTQVQRWQSGQYFPQHKNYVAIDHHRVRHLPQPGRYQRWYRINQQYVLVNTRDHRIVRVHH